MNAEMIDTPFRLRLVGKRGPVPDASYGPTGLKLMGQLWAAVCERDTATRGINHWVYLPGGEMFTGVELTDPSAGVEGLESLDVLLPRYLRAAHTGPYSELPALWAGLRSHLARLGETPTALGVEVYDHWCENPAELRTTVLIGLERRADG